MLIKFTYDAKLKRIATSLGESKRLPNDFSKLRQDPLKARTLLNNSFIKADIFYENPYVANEEDVYNFHHLYK